ncbi:MAG: hypothetical protein QW290_08565, partial [Sulfolobales archaeon]
EYGLTLTDYILVESIRNQIKELSVMMQLMTEETALMRLRMEVDRLTQEAMQLELASEAMDLYIQQATSEDEDDYIEQDQESEEDHD